MKNVAGLGEATRLSTGRSVGEARRHVRSESCDRPLLQTRLRSRRHNCPSKLIPITYLMLDQVMLFFPRHRKKSTPREPQSAACGIDITKFRKLIQHALVFLRIQMELIESVWAFARRNCRATRDARACRRKRPSAICLAIWLSWQVNYTDKWIIDSRPWSFETRFFFAWWRVCLRMLGKKDKRRRSLNWRKLVFENKRRRRVIRNRCVFWGSRSLE